MPYTHLTPMERMKRAKIQAINCNPFIGYLANFIRLVELPPGDTTVKVMGIDKYANLAFSPKGIKDLSEQELLGAFLHEVLHTALLHHVNTMIVPDHDIMNYAMDAVVNYMLDTLTSHCSYSFCLPSGTIIPDPQGKLLLEIGESVYKLSVPDKSWEDIYDEILSLMRSEGVFIPVPVGVDSHLFHRNAPINGTDSNGNKIDRSNFRTDLDPTQVSKERLLQAADIAARTPNSIGEYISRMIGVLTKPKINWRNELRKAISAHVKCRYSFSSPSRRGAALPLRLPSLLDDDSKVEIFFFVDVSASIADQEYDACISELYSIIGSWKQIRITLFSVDTIIHDIIELTQNNKEKIKTLQLTGGGGTDFRSAYEYVERNYHRKPKISIFFTDGYAIFPKHELKGSQTIWLMPYSQTEIASKVVPFGRKLPLEISK